MMERRGYTSQYGLETEAESDIVGTIRVCDLQWGNSVLVCGNSFMKEYKAIPTVIRHAPISKLNRHIVPLDDGLAK
eukprot:scaffold83436_cov27-Prasinocladus_malaysianus.AAC.1